jgi:hypothetical protein
MWHSGVIGEMLAAVSCAQDALLAWRVREAMV